MAIFAVLSISSATVDHSSICAIAAVVIDDGHVIHRYSSIIDPETAFDPFQVGLHGICETQAKGAPRLTTALPDLLPILADTLVVTDGPFGMVGLLRAARAARIEFPSMNWADCRRLAREAWPDFLGADPPPMSSVAEWLGLEMQWRDPARRAAALGAVAENAFRRGARPAGTLLRDGIPMEPRALVLTGSFSASVERVEQLARRSGMSVTAKVTRETGLVCVGGSSIGEPVHHKSPEHRTAEALIGGGAAMSLISEADLIHYLGAEPPPQPWRGGDNRDCDESAGEALTV